MIYTRQDKEDKVIPVSIFTNNITNNSRINFIKKIEIKIPKSGFLSIGKITSRPTMSAGYITYSFLSNPAMKTTSYFCNAGNGLESVSALVSFEKPEVNSFLDKIQNLKLRGCLFKHFREVFGNPIESLKYNQIEYKLDDSSQSDKAKNIPQQHAVHLASGSALYPSDTPSSANQCHLAFVKATQLDNIESIDYQDCKKDSSFIRCITVRVCKQIR